MRMATCPFCGEDFVRIDEAQCGSESVARTQMGPAMTAATSDCVCGVEWRKMFYVMIDLTTFHTTPVFPLRVRSNV